jgi:kinesin family protein 18/19
LKKSKGSTLGSVVEGDEQSSQDIQPLADMNFNRRSPTDDSTSSSDELHIPKAKDRHLGSPGKRMPSSIKGPSLSASTSRAPATRRRSNLGPVRGEKSRRRSSMIPQLSPPAPDGGKAGARRVVVITSPSKRPKRPSLTKLGNGAGGSLRVKPIPALSLSATSLSVGDLSVDLSGGKAKPTWR